MAITTILKLPAQSFPAAGSELLEGISVTIWFFGCLVTTAAFDHVLNRRPRKTWPEFRPVLVGTALLSFWYLFITLDRWLHYGQTRVVYGYIFVLPIIEIFRIASTIYYLWGTYIVIWKELEDRFPKRQQGYWWFAARCAIFIVGLVSTYYATLFIAQVGVWVQFLSLNTIADVATKRTGFEITMTAFFCNRIYLLLATSFLLIRSIFEFVLTLRAWGPYSTRQSLQPIKDVGYGIITLVYLGLMYVTAHVVSSGRDKGGREVRFIESDIRDAVLKRLKQEIYEGRLRSPPFVKILDQIGSDLNTILRDGPLSGTIETSAHRDQTAKAYLQSLRRHYGNLDPREGRNNGLGSASIFSGFFSQRNGSGQLRGSTTKRTQSQPMGQATASAPPVPTVQNGRLAPSRHTAAFSPQPSIPSRWAPSVSVYTETVASAHETPPDRNSFRERMRHAQ
ncbi:hypothetical protein F5B21DRAFT_517694 [Xylaria acuta]|nr:hypothetical protein F5B21DRAFT_517694 [Xylaria acuta]